MLDRRTLLNAAAATPLTLAGLARAAEPGPVTVPITLVQDQAAVDVRVNGAGPFRFVLRTGANASAGIDQALAERLHITEFESAGVHETYDRDSFSSRRVTVYLARELIVGGVGRQNHVFLMGMEDPIADGVIPAQLLNDRQCLLDFEARTLTVHPTGAPDRAGFTPIAYGPQDHHRLVVEGLFEDRKVRLAVDTGASVALQLRPRFVRSMNLWSRPGLEGSDPFHPAWRPWRTIKASSLQVGPWKFRDPIVQLTSPELTDAGDIDGWIGIDLLRRFSVGFDDHDHRLWLKPNRFIADFFRYNRSGLGLRWAGGETVATTVEGPALKAGLRPGDRLGGLPDRRAVRDLVWRLTGARGDVVAVDAGGRPATIVLEDRL